MDNLKLLSNLCELNEISFPICKMSQNSIHNIFKLLTSEYCIFLTHKYFNVFNVKLLRYFSKYNIIYFDYNDKTDILNVLNILNNIIKLNENSVKIVTNNTYEKIVKISKENGNKICQNNLFNNLKKNLNLIKLKVLYFLENTIEPNTLYKKISFSKEELFLSFENYIVKKREYKLRTFCQIAEKLGAQEININSNSYQEKNNSLSISMSAPVPTLPVPIEIDNTNRSLSEKMENINLNFKYNNCNYNLNLNKFHIINLIEEESEFFISKEEFNSDIDLKFLIDARCLNLIQTYNTNIIINKFNELEKKISIKAMKYDLNMGYYSSNLNYTSLNIIINFIDIYKFPECINGNNLYVLKEGFYHLANIIKTTNSYVLIHNFLKSHLTYSNKYMNCINNDYELIYENIFLNFKEDELNELYIEYFKDNMNYQHFINFKNILLQEIRIEDLIFKEKSDVINKFYFVCYQYHKIIKTNNNVIDTIKNYINESYNEIFFSNKNIFNI
jgi:hypothetical protein